ncbi:N1-acetylpolyamine oxidase [Diaporthe helianthi]|uniref:N1-acetylpolyamine oxidase n=1 Tax=Diaporthe helianthi TaxID=158607 RepID=A0A2P5HRK5_DIAHE|nr:N1-acetylpolyamine oxidase [Diaporthe helianthi]
MSLLEPASATPTKGQRGDKQARSCRKTKVAVLGSGVAGISAAQALFNASITDFLIVDRNDYIGGRLAHTTFGSKPDGTSYTVELGANWVQGLEASDSAAPENPIWTFSNTYSDYDSILTYDETGASYFSDLLAEFDSSWAAAATYAGSILTENLQDTSACAGLSAEGWKPRRDMKKAAAEWWQWDWDASYPPEQSSLVFGITGDNLTFNQYGQDNNFVVEPRGFNAWLVGEASTFLDLPGNDPRLLLNTTVSRIVHSGSEVTVHLCDGQCISAEHAVCTFSLGVLQNDIVDFEPRLPPWKRESIEQFQMGTYTKVFYQFDTTFWPQDVQFFVYADPEKRGYFPVWQSLSTKGFLPGSNIIFATVVEDESHRVQKQSDDQTKREGLEVLRKMFPDVDIPEPIDFKYPRWTTEPWTHGSYSNWPMGMTLEKHQNLRANVGALWFAGEHTSAQYYGFLQGSWFEGHERGVRIAAALKGNGTAMQAYDVLQGTTEPSEYDATNGWPVSSFVNYNAELAVP